MSHSFSNHPFVIKLKHNQTPEELVFFKILQSCLLEHFPGLQHHVTKQVAFRHNDSFYIVDFYIGSIRLGFEIDGGYHWQSEQLDRDLKRDAFLSKRGVRLHHIPNDDVVIEERRKKLIAKLPFWINERIHFTMQWRKDNLDFKHRKGTPKSLKKLLNASRPNVVSSPPRRRVTDTTGSA